MIKEMQRNAAFRDPTRAAAHLVGAPGQRNAGRREANRGRRRHGLSWAWERLALPAGSNPQALFQMGQQQRHSLCKAHRHSRHLLHLLHRHSPPLPLATAGPAPAAMWLPVSSAPECGAKKPEPPKASAEGAWTCPTCGASNKGKFCAECGTKKPAGVPQYKCGKCGWEPADPTKPPKFCPECGDPFDDGDIV